MIVIMKRHQPAPTYAEKGSTRSINRAWSYVHPVCEKWQRTQILDGLDLRFSRDLHGQALMLLSATTLLLRCSTPLLLLLLLLLPFIPTPAIIEIAQVRAVELRLIEHGVDLIVDKTRPASRGVPRRDLRRVLGEMLLEMRGAFAAVSSSALFFCSARA